MWKYKYGEFSDEQMNEAKERMRGQIFFLLLIVDPAKCNDYQNIDVCAAFENALHKIGGLNSALNYPSALVNVISSLEAAYNEYKTSDTITADFKHSRYRKLVLDAINEVSNIKPKEV